MPNFRGAAVAGFSGLVMIAAAAAGGLSAAATEPAASPASTPTAVQADAAGQRDITKPSWRPHSTHHSHLSCRHKGALIEANGTARETMCFEYNGSWFLFYR